METATGYDLESLMRSYGNDVLRTAYMYVKDKDNAEDIFQNVFLKVNQNLHTFEGNSNIKTWIIRITINACKDFLKSAYQRHNVPMDEFIEDHIVSDDDFTRIEQRETIHTVKEAVMALPKVYQEVVLCVYFQEMSMQQAASVLDVPVGTIKSRLKRAKDKLKEMLQGRVDYEPGK